MAKLLMVQRTPLPDGIAQKLESAGYRLELVREPATAIPSKSDMPDMVVVDGTTLSAAPGFVGNLRKAGLNSPVIAVVDASQSTLASEAMQEGATDYLLKPFTPDQLLSALEHAISVSRPIPDMIVSSPASQQVLLLAKKAAQTNASILISGESGTGKERLARFIHDQSPRAAGPYVAVNCAAIPETMLESTLFGHAKGAFTGATQSQTGKFELANGGSLLLDEIGELPLDLQAKLLRVLQERELEKIGSNRKVQLDVRVIAATNRDLREDALAGRFRQDLFYRLDVLPLQWPALRQRPEDILPLASYFLEKYSPEGGFQLHPDAARALLHYNWPGNVRELENTVQRALILARGQMLQVDDLMLPQEAPSEPSSVRQLHLSRRGAEFQAVLDALHRFNGHRQQTAQALGVTTRALRYKLAAMREHGIDINQAAVNG